MKLKNISFSILLLAGLSSNITTSLGVEHRVATEKENLRAIIDIYKSVTGKQVNDAATMKDILHHMSPEDTGLILSGLLIRFFNYEKYPLMTLNYFGNLVAFFLKIAYEEGHLSEKLAMNLTEIIKDKMVNPKTRATTFPTLKSAHKKSNIVLLELIDHAKMYLDMHKDRIDKHVSKEDLAKIFGELNQYKLKFEINEAMGIYPEFDTLFMYYMEIKTKTADINQKIYDQREDIYENNGVQPHLAIKDELAEYMNYISLAKIIRNRLYPQNVLGALEFGKDALYEWWTHRG